jgi:hypothetical protein
VKTLPIRFFRRFYAIPQEIQRGEVYYLVDWDFREHKEKRSKARKELLKALGVRTIRERTSTTSVIPIETLEKARQLYEILTKYGAIVNVRECRTINIE